MIFGVSNDAFLFCSCILVLLFRTRQDLTRILLRSINGVFHLDHCCYAKSILDLPVIRFEDLQDRRGQRSFDELCFMCMKEYKKDDVVTQLSRCGHVYHTECLVTLINNCEFTCPFCKTSIFRNMTNINFFSF